MNNEFASIKFNIGNGNTFSKYYINDNEVSKEVYDEEMARDTYLRENSCDLDCDNCAEDMEDECECEECQKYDLIGEYIAKIQFTDGCPNCIGRILEEFYDDIYSKAVDDLEECEED